MRGFYLVRILFSSRSDINYTISNVYIYMMTKSKYPNIDEVERKNMVSGKFYLSFNMTVNIKERDNVIAFHNRIRNEFRKVVREKCTIIEEIPVVFYYVSNSSAFPQPWR